MIKGIWKDFKSGYIEARADLYIQTYGITHVTAYKIGYWIGDQVWVYNA